MPIAPPQTTNHRAPGSFSTNFAPASYSESARHQIRRVHSDTSDDSIGAELSPLSIPKRTQNAQAQRQYTSPLNSSAQSTTSFSNSPLNFSRPSTPRSNTADSPSRSAEPHSFGGQSFVDAARGHIRKHSQSQGHFDGSLSGLAYPPTSAESMAPNPNLSASQIAAQAAMQHGSIHARQRSQTLPLDNNLNGPRRPSKGPVSPPLLSLTEASGERQSGFGSFAAQGGQADQGGRIYRNGLLGGSTNPAATAANVVFSRSPQASPSLSPSEFTPQFREPERPAKPEKPSKVKLFSRPGKIGTKDSKEKPFPSPNRLGGYTASALQGNNMSTTSLAETASSASSMYSMANSSTATIRAVDVPTEKDNPKERKTTFLSRQKHKLSNKDDHHLPLSSASSNSRPVDPSAPTSLYNFNLPPSPGPSSTSFSKSMSGLDLRHGGRALRERKKEEKAAAGSESRESEMTYTGSSEWPGPSSLNSGGGGPFLTTGTGYSTSSDVHHDLNKYGLNNMTADDAWPFLKAKLLIIFEGEDLRLPVEDFNRLVSAHVQRCIQKRTPNVIVEDLRDLLITGFSSLDQKLRRTPDERLIPQLVELWLFTFTSILPYMQAIFLPLDLEFSGHGSLMSSERARDFWGAIPLNNSASGPASNIPAGKVLEVRRIALTAYRDTVILPRYETLKTIFSRLSLESINSNLNNLADIMSSSPDTSASGGRPGTAMSLDPAHASYNSQTSTLLSGADSSGARSRAISNVSYGSDQASSIRGNIDSNMMPPPPIRPFTPSSTHPSLLSINHSRDAVAVQREVNAEDSKLVTETVGRMLQCVSVLASVGVVTGDGSAGDEEAQARMEDLCKTLKLNWLGRGRTGRNRRGFVAAKVRRATNESLAPTSLL